MKQNVLNTAERMFKEHGVANVSRENLCEVAGIPPGSFTNIMGVTFGEFVREYDEEEFPTITRGRVDKVLREKYIVRAAFDTAREIGYRNMTKNDVAKRLEMSAGGISVYFKTFDELRERVLKRAIKLNEGRILAQAILANDPLVDHISDEQREIAARSVANR